MKKYSILPLLLVLLAACSSGPPPAPKQFPFFKQKLAYDCAPTCLKMMYAYYGEDYPEEELMKRLKTTRKGTSFKAMVDVSTDLGYTTVLVGVDMDFLKNDIKLPCIVDWNANHVVVVYKVDATHIYVADPAADSLLTYDKNTFMQHWMKGSSENKGVALAIYKM